MDTPQRSQRGTPQPHTSGPSWAGTVWLALMVLALSAICWESELPNTLSVILTPLGFPNLPFVTHVAPNIAQHDDTSAVTIRTLEGEVGQQTCTGSSRDVINASAVVSQGEWICGDLRVYNGTATIIGRVGGSVTVAHGAVAITGVVDGNVTVLGGSATLRLGARVGGSISVVGGTLLRADHTFVGGPVSTDTTLHQEAITNVIGFDSSFTFPWSHVVFWVAVGAALAFFFPRHLALVHRSVRDELPQSLGVGILAALTGGIVTVVLVVTCIGIPIAVLLMGALWAAWVVGTVAAGSWLGSRLLGERLPEQHPQLVATLLGVTVLALAKAIPCVGSIVSLIVGCAGLGASVLALMYMRRSKYLTRLPQRREPVSL